MKPRSIFLPPRRLHALSLHALSLHAFALYALALILLSAFRPFSPSAFSADASAPARPRILGIAHVALYYTNTNADAELAFFKDYLGYDESYCAKNPDGSRALTWIKINDLQHIALLPVPAENPDADRLRQVAFVTTDCEAMRQYLKSQGCKVPAADATTAAAGPAGPAGNRAFTIEDPDGHAIEFVEYAGDALPLKDKGLCLPPTRVLPRIRHFGVTCADLAASLHFYKDILGCVETWRGARNAGELSWVNLRLPGCDEYLELMLYGGPEPKTAQLRSMNHICLEAPDVPAAYAELQKRVLPEACKRPGSPPKTGLDHKRQFGLFDPEGTRVEVMEPATTDGAPAPWSNAPIPIPDKLKSRQ